MSKCRVRVIKRTLHEELVEAYVSDARPDFGQCGAFEDGQEFIIESFPLKPEGFCDWAWADIHRDVVGVMFGASYPWIRKPRTAITCCTDGLRPVVFQVEALE